MDTLPQETLKFSHERGYQNSLGFPTILQFSLWVGSQKKSHESGSEKKKVGVGYNFQKFLKPPFIGQFFVCFH
jgi:hypothetical protein